MPIPFRSEEAAHLEFLRYQRDLEAALTRLHKDVDETLAAIIARNTNDQGLVDKTKIKLIVDKYVDSELKAFRRDFMAQVKSGVADSATLGVRSVVGAVAPHRKITSTVWTDMAARVRRTVVDVRGIDGLTLSDRVWKLTRDNAYELKRIISGDILQGTSAARISRDIRGFLRQPATLRGAARDALRPGTGTYKSAYKNAMRLARTETNRAYVGGQRQTAKSMGYKLQFRLSDAHPVPDECDAFDGKIFEPDEFPAPIHPNCMCHGLTVLPDQQEV